ncbi:MAG: hypothetical protein ABEJ56_06925 [Candidatus Nanohaloarchaea archaeon]
MNIGETPSSESPSQRELSDEEEEMAVEFYKQIRRGDMEVFPTKEGVKEAEQKDEIKEKIQEAEEVDNIKERAEKWTEIGDKLQDYKKDKVNLEEIETNSEDELNEQEKRRASEIYRQIQEGELAFSRTEKGKEKTTKEDKRRTIEKLKTQAEEAKENGNYVQAAEIWDRISDLLEELREENQESEELRSEDRSEVDISEVLEAESVLNDEIRRRFIENFVEVTEDGERIINIPDTKISADNLSDSLREDGLQSVTIINPSMDGHPSVNVTAYFKGNEGKKVHETFTLNEEAVIGGDWTSLDEKFGFDEIVENVIEVEKNITDFFHQIQVETNPVKNSESGVTSPVREVGDGRPRIERSENLQAFANHPRSLTGAQGIENGPFEGYFVTFFDDHIFLESTTRGDAMYYFETDQSIIEDKLDMNKTKQEVFSELEQNPRKRIVSESKTEDLVRDLLEPKINDIGTKREARNQHSMNRKYHPHYEPQEPDFSAEEYKRKVREEINEVV